MGLLDIVPAGVVTGDNVQKIFNYARDHGFAIPAINCTSSSTVNAALEGARNSKSPLIIQFSNGGAAYFAGKGIANDKQQASILGSIAGAHHVRLMAKHYGVPVILHSDHCARKLLPWFEGMIQADEAYFKEHGEPLFSSHMLDLSEEPKEKNIATCVEYLKRMAPMKCLLEMEIGITGGEEDGVDNSSAEAHHLYTPSEEVWEVYEAFSKHSDLFSIAAAFGNVHGVYKPGNVHLRPELIGEHQKFIQKKLGCKSDKPAFFVFHGGSGSSPADIKTAVSFGVVKMNIDTDTQWAYWEGVKTFYDKNHGYLQAQVGNPDGDDKPNKKYYDPRVWVREGEKTMIARVELANRELGNVNHL